MSHHSTSRVYEGSVGATVHGGRRAQIAQVLRSASDSMSVIQVAETVGIHANTARFHLESLVDAGLATRETEASTLPGRRRILYRPTPPAQLQERAQGYRLLARILSSTIAAAHPEVIESMYDVGLQWGAYLTNRPAPFEVLDEAEIDQRVLDRLDPLWFSHDLRNDGGPQLAFHQCPFVESARLAPEVVCRLHAGMVNGSLAELRSTQRMTTLCPMTEPYLCLGALAPLKEVGDQPVQLNLPVHPDPADSAKPAS